MEMMQIISAIVILAAIIYFSWREHRRKNPKRRVFRMLATLVCFASIYCLLYPVTWTGKKFTDGKRLGIILTEGYSQDSIQSAIENNESALVIEGADLFKAPADISHFQLFGYGFPIGTRFSEMPSVISFNPTRESEGVTAVYWNQKVITGNELRVQGRYRNSSQNMVTLKLSVFGKVEDSVLIQPYAAFNFTLKSIPRFNGRAVYQLFALSGKDTLESNAVPVKVISADKPTIIMLSSSPGFEQKFFQDWLSGESFSVISRVRTSKDKIERKYLNVSKQTQQQTLLNQIRSADVLICDTEEFDRLSSSDRQSVFNYVSETGLGLLITADSILPRQDILRKSFSLTAANKISNSIKFKPGENKSLVAVPADGHARFLKQSENSISIIRDSADRVLVGQIKYGRGSIVISLMPSLYPLALSGNQFAFAKLWTTIINAAALKDNRRERIGTDTRFPVVDEEMSFTLISGDNNAKKLSVDNVNIALEQDADPGGFYKGKYWPEKEGWLDKITSNSDTASVYIYSDKDWKNIRMQERINYTKQLIKNNADKRETLSPAISHRKKLPDVFLYLMLILSTVFLWIEKKFA
ncbi:hypothetical protein [Pollutibacter soli]|uniref:hypothetical protein n=1 Tax=Pollutibacter soli TaxID=3034157 RepID=UPI003013AF63